MKLSNEVLQYLNIESFYVIQNEKYCMCLPLEVHLGTWKISIDTDSLDENKPAKLKIKTKGNFELFPIAIKQITADDILGFVYEATIIDTNACKTGILQKIEEIESKIQSWNHRKEERYDIGTSEEKAQLMNFKNIEQNIIVDNQNLPCVINNVSYSGVKLTTLEANFYVDKKLLLCLSFNNPIEQIHLVGTVRNCLLKNIKDKLNMSVVSLEFEESPISYKERLTKYINKLNKL